MRSFCCEACWRNPTCGNECGSCASEPVCDCGHPRSDHLNDGPCIHGDGDDGCLAFNEAPRTPQAKGEP